MLRITSENLMSDTAFQSGFMLTKQTEKNEKTDNVEFHNP
jgi:hypothetical protein